MVEFPIIVYGNGDLYRECFNAIALTVGHSTYETLFKLTTILAVFSMMLSYITSKDYMDIVKWLGIFYLAFYVLFVPKVTVHIIDRINFETDSPVDHVPFGLAVFASYTSLIGDASTRLLEQTFTLPDDLKYNKTGMVMASRMIAQAANFQITDSEFNENAQEFMQQCVFYDLLLKKYSISELSEATNTWNFIKENTSPARSFRYNGEIKTCRDGAKSLASDFNAVAKKMANQYGSRILPGQQDPGNSLLRYLGSAYNFVLPKISENGASIFKEHLIADLLNKSVLRMDGRLDAGAAMRSYTYTRANDQMVSSFNTTGDLFAEWVQHLKNAIEIICYALFIFVLLFAVFPSGLKIIKNYLSILLWLQLWAPLYAVVNMIVTFYARNNLGYSNNALNLASLPAIISSNADMTALAGYLTLSVPILSFALIKGMEVSIAQIASSFSGALQGAATGAAAEAVMGNINLGNMSSGNQNINNASANHYDTSARFSAGMLQTQLPQGATLLTTPDGRQVVDVRATQSNLASDVALTQRLSSSLSQQADHALSTTLNKAHAYNESNAENMKNYYDLGSQSGKGISHGDAYAISNSQSVNDAYRQSMQLTERFAHDNKISFGEAKRILSAASGEVRLGSHADFGLKVPFVGGAGVSANESIGTRRDSSHQSSVDHHTLYDKAKNFLRDSNYLESVDYVERSLHDQSLRTNSDFSERLASNVAASYDKSEAYRKEVVDSYQQYKSYREAASNVRENAASYSISLQNDLANYIANMPSPNGKGKIGMEHVPDIRNNTELYQHYVDSFLESKISSMHIPDLSNTKNDVRNTFNHNEEQVISKDPHSTFINNKETIKTEAYKRGLLDENVLDDSLGQRVKDSLKTAQTDLHQRKQSLEQHGRQFSKSFEEEKHRPRSTNIVRDAFDNVDTTDYNKS